VSALWCRKGDGEWRSARPPAKVGKSASRRAPSAVPWPTVSTQACSIAGATWAGCPSAADPRRSTSVRRPDRRRGHLRRSLGVAASTSRTSGLDAEAPSPRKRSSSTFGWLRHLRASDLGSPVRRELVAVDRMGGATVRRPGIPGGRPVIAWLLRGASPPPGLRTPSIAVHRSLTGQALAASPTTPARPAAATGHDRDSAAALSLSEQDASSRSRAPFRPRAGTPVTCPTVAHQPQPERDPRGPSPTSCRSARPLPTTARSLAHPHPAIAG
jgi:hypothetical protein